MRTCLQLASAVSLALCAAGAAQAVPVFHEPTPYLSVADSPFSAGTFNYFHTETFENHLLDTPGLSADAGGVTSVVFGPSIHDSVDADDGTIDGSGLGGDSYFTSLGPTGVRFSFSAAVLGALPTSAGVVWTDGGGGASVTFSVFGATGNLLFTATRSGFADGSNNGETAEDRFFGVTDPDGISAIFMSNSSGGMEVDHVQYGAAAVAAIPEPETYMLLLAGLAVVARVARKRGKA